MTNAEIFEAVKQHITPELVEQFNQDYQDAGEDVTLLIEDLHNIDNWSISKPEECDGSLWNESYTWGRDLFYTPSQDFILCIQGTISTNPANNKILSISIYPE